MKKTVIIFAALLGICLLGFLWLLAQASPTHAPDDVVTIDLDDTYEK